MFQLMLREVVILTILIASRSRLNWLRVSSGHFVLLETLFIVETMKQLCDILHGFAFRDDELNEQNKMPATHN